MCLLLFAAQTKEYNTLSLLFVLLCISDNFTSDMILNRLFLIVTITANNYSKNSTCSNGGGDGGVAGVGVGVGVAAAVTVFNNSKSSSNNSCSNDSHSSSNNSNNHSSNNSNNLS